MAKTKKLQKFYNSKAWKSCRQGYISNRMLVDGGLCEECHCEQGFILHHEIMLDDSNVDDANVSLNWKHLKWVCKQCHDEYEGHGVVGTKKKQSSVRFDDSGRVIPNRK